MSETPESDAAVIDDQTDDNGDDVVGNHMSQESAAASDAPSENEIERGALGVLPAWASSERLALWIFIAFVVAAVPLILFHFGSYHWFFRDDFVFLAEPRGTFPPFLKPHGGAHWVAVPRAIYFVLWQIFGLTSYVPYQACVVALHLGAVVLLRVVMRRAGVGPWLATAAASILVLFGPGAQNIVWAFQISFVGSLTWGLVQLLLADHDGPADRRDVLGVLAGFVAIMSSGVGLTMALVVGIAVFLRRGWRAAALHVVPLVALYVAWSLVAHPNTDGAAGRPTVGVLASWIRSAEIGTFLGLGHFRPVAVLFAIILVVGTTLAVLPRGDRSFAEVRQRLAMPVALFVGAVAFAASSGLGRWWTGDQAARASRYVYLGAAMTLPLLAVAAQELARRRRVLTPAFVVLLALVIPFNLAGFTPTVFGKAYMDQHRDVATTAVRMPFARRVPGNVRPLADPFGFDAVTISFLLNAQRNGDLNPSTFPIGPETTNEFKIRLGVAQQPTDGYPLSCQSFTEPKGLSTSKGETLVIGDPVRVATLQGPHRSGPWVAFDPRLGGNRLKIELPGLHLLIAPAKGAGSFRLCDG